MDPDIAFMVENKLVLANFEGNPFLRGYLVNKRDQSFDIAIPEGA